MPPFLTMRFQATFALPVLLIFSGCATHEYYGGGYSSGPPDVSLVSALVSDDSPAHSFLLLNPFPLPIYPWDFVRAGVTGEVTVRLFIGKDGGVIDAKIIKSSFKELSDSVLNASSLWRFRETPEWPRTEPKGLIIDCRIKFSIE